MKVIIYLYRRHDIDLVTLYKNPNFGFKKVLIKAIRSYVNNKPYIISAPKVYNAAEKEFHSRYRVEINFNETEDADIIAWLKTIKERYRCVTLKCIMRGCIVGPIIYGCTIDNTDCKKTEIIYSKIKAAIPNLYDAPMRTKAQENKLLKVINKAPNNKEKNDVDSILSSENNIENKIQTHKDEILNFLKELVIKDTSPKPTSNPVFIDSAKPFNDTVSKDINENKEKINISNDNSNNNSKKEKKDINTTSNENEMLKMNMEFGDFGDSDTNVKTDETNNTESEDFDMFSDINTLLTQF